MAKKESGNGKLLEKWKEDKDFNIKAREKRESRKK